MTLKTPKAQAATDLDILFATGNPWIESATYKGESIFVMEDSIDEINTNLPGFTVPIYGIKIRETDVAKPKAGDAVVYKGQSCKVSGSPGPRNEGNVWSVRLERETIQA